MGKRNPHFAQYQEQAPGNGAKHMESRVLWVHPVPVPTDFMRQ